MKLASEITCMVCGQQAPGSEEHVVPQWAKRSFSIPGPVTVNMGTHSEPVRAVRDLRALNITLDGHICKKCNSGTLSRMENSVADILKPMVVSHQATRLTPESQRLLATWAIKTVYLLELAVRQNFPGRPIEGFVASEAERAWLFSKLEPPPRSNVWLACWDAQSSSALMYEPSGVPLTTKSGPPLNGQLTSFALGFVAFQVFSVDFVAAESKGANHWRPDMPPEPIGQAFSRIWPSPLISKDLDWPGPAIAHDDWNSFVTWGGVLRSSK